MILAQTIQVHVSGDPTLDLITLGLAIVTAVMAGATVWLGIQTRASVAVSQTETNATLKLVKEARRDRELAIQPILRLRHAVPTMEVQNIGRGPALRVRLFTWRADTIYWTAALASLSKLAD